MQLSTYARRLGFAAAATTVLATSTAAVVSAAPGAEQATAASSAPEAAATSPYDPRQMLVALSLPGQQPQADEAAVAAAAAPAETAVAAAAAPEMPVFITPEQLGEIVPQIPADKLHMIAGPLNAAMVNGGIDNPLRKA
ncbi:MAG: hypothetical protein GX542_10305, partial [Rhodococcus sp.]|nr:hypothetical protein [Rhodococcus sp. (in: high G+C Gram-positive bacteria)]